MNSRILFALVLLAAVVCIAWAQQEQQQQQQQQSGQTNPNCPMQRTKAALNQMQQTMQRMTQQARQALQGARQSRANPTSAVLEADIKPVTRKRRQTDELFEGPASGPDPMEPERAPVPANGVPKFQATPRDMAVYNQTIQEQESRMHHLMRQIMNSPYMPTREQAIQLATTVLTLLLMMLLGPAIGPSAAIVQLIVKQVVPLLVAASVHYAADHAVPMKPLPSASSVVSAQIAPVQVQPSMMGQTI